MYTDRNFNEWFKKKQKEAKNPVPPVEVTEGDKDLAKKAIEWAVNMTKQPTESLDDYLWNLAAASSQGIVVEKTAGIMASLPSAYQRANSPIDKSGYGKTIPIKAKVLSSQQTKFGSTMWKFQSQSPMIAMGLPEGKEL